MVGLCFMCFIRLGVGIACLPAGIYLRWLMAKWKSRRRRKEKNEVEREHALRLDCTVYMHASFIFRANVGCLLLFICQSAGSSIGRGRLGRLQIRRAFSVPRTLTLTSSHWFNVTAIPGGRKAEPARGRRESAAKFGRESDAPSSEIGQPS